MSKYKKYTIEVYSQIESERYGIEKIKIKTLTTIAVSEAQALNNVRYRTIGKKSGLFYSTGSYDKELCYEIVKIEQL